MRKTSIQINGHVYIMRELSCEQVLSSLTACEILSQKYWSEDLNPELLQAMCENAVLGFNSIYDGEEKKFSSPDEVLKTLSLSELASIFDIYDQAFSKKHTYSRYIEMTEVEI